MYKLTNIWMIIILFFCISWGFIFGGIIAQSLNVNGLPIVMIYLSGVSHIISLLIYFVFNKDKKRIKNYFNRLFRLGNSFWPAFFVFSIIPVLSVISILLMSFFNPNSENVKISEIFLAEPVLFVFSAFFFGPLPEELLFRGVILEELRSIVKPIWASIILGFLWSIWHIPLMFISSTYQNKIAFSFLSGFKYCFSVFLYSVITDWIYIKNNRSILMAVIFHFMVNFTGELFVGTQDYKNFQIIFIFCLAVYALCKINKPNIFLYRS